MPKKIHGLGRGLDALLPESDAAQGAGQEISIGDIDPNPDQPRRTFTEESIAQLAQSIRDQGVLQPILVTPKEDGRYQLVAGERRWRAARVAGLETVPCLVRDLDEVQQREIALIENLQREDLNPLEAAQGVQNLMRQCGYTQETVARRLGKSRPAVANLLRLLNLPDEVQEMVRQGVLSAGHARVIAGVEGEAAQLALAKEAVARDLSVRQLEAVAAARKQTGVPDRKKPRVLSAELSELEGRIREATGLRATLQGSEKKGKIVLQYYSREELERLSDFLGRLGD